MIDVRRTLENLHQILPDLSIEDLFRVLDNIVEIPQFNVGQTTTIRRDDSGDHMTQVHLYLMLVME